MIGSEVKADGGGLELGESPSAAAAAAVVGGGAGGVGDSLEDG